MAVQLHWGDYISLVGYFLLIIGFGIWSSCKNRGTVSGYFLAGRSMHFIPVGASLFAANIGSGHFIGLAGAGAASGIGTAGFEIVASFVLVLLGWVFLPVYIRAGVFTMPEYIKKRFGGDRIRIYLSILSLLLYIFTKISVDLFSGALFIKLALDLNLYVAIVILLAIAAFFTIGGGLTAVIWTDVIQTVIMIIGAVYLMITSFIRVGGFSEMKAKYMYAISNTTLFSDTKCGLPRDDYFNLVRGIDSDYPWPGMLLGATISSVWYWCSDQVIVQRTLAAKNLNHAKAGCVLAGVLKFLPMFLIVFPGLVARILYPDEIACSDPVICEAICGTESGCSNIAYPSLVIKLLPPGARGLMLAVMVAALMSSLTSIFNSSSTIFTMDIWKRIRADAKDWELMIVGRVFVLVLVAVSILWIPIIEASQGSRLFDYIQSLTSYFAPPICAVFVMAVLFKRINEQGAFWGMMIGFFAGIIRFILDVSYTSQPCELSFLEKRPAIITKVHYLHFGILLFFITCIASWIISILTKPIPDKYIKRLTYFSVHDEVEPIPIPNSKGCGSMGFCAAADLSDTYHFETNKSGKSNEALTHQPEKQVKNSTDVKNKSKSNRKVNPFKKALYFICGIESALNENNEDLEVEPPIDTSIYQDPFWARIINICAILVLCASGFYVAFFNDYNY